MILIFIHHAALPDLWNREIFTVTVIARARPLQLDEK